MINEEYGLDTRNKSKVEMFSDLNGFLIEEYSRNRHCVLIIDEAQNLSGEMIEEIRLLSNLETDKSKLLQIILVGQPELRETLSDPSLVQFTQRITMACHIRPLTLNETEEYIMHRFAVAGNPDAVEFESGVINKIHEYTGGIPRLINVVCEWALLSAFSDRSRIIDGDLVRDITQEITSEHLGGREPARTQKNIKRVNLEDVAKDLELIKGRLGQMETLVGGLGLALLEKLLEVPDKRYGNVEAAASLKKTLLNLINKDHPSGADTESTDTQRPVGSTERDIPLKLVKPDSG